MTNERIPSKNKYKHVLIHSKGTPAKYTSCRMSWEDYTSISPQWQGLKLKVLERDHYICKDCGSPINVQVHHTRYPELWGEETIDDLITLCDECHAKKHGKD